MKRKYRKYTNEYMMYLRIRHIYKDALPTKGYQKDLWQRVIKEYKRRAEILIEAKMMERYG